MRRKPINLKGQRFGKLKVIRPSKRRERSSRQWKYYWWVRCDCGTLKRICEDNLIHNDTKSCGYVCGQSAKTIDLTGKKFGHWTVLRRDRRRQKRRCAQTRWWCRCECGSKKSVQSCNLRSGESTSCGCVRHGLDLTGQKFGHWTVLRLTKNPHRRAANGWMCRCGVCGVEKFVQTQDLTDGKSKSCGCLHRADVDQLTRNSYCSMLQRCTNPNNNSYDDYGGRGIYVCLRWQESILNFLEDMGPRPSKGMTLDRIDVNGNYEPGNCRWADWETQCKNKRKHYIEPVPKGDIVHVPLPDECDF